MKTRFHNHSSIRHYIIRPLTCRLPSDKHSAAQNHSDQENQENMAEPSMSAAQPQQPLQNTVGFHDVRRSQIEHFFPLYESDRVFGVNAPLTVFINLDAHFKRC